MTIKPVFLISSLIVSAGAALTSFTAPAQAFITHFTTFVPYANVVGFSRTFTDTMGRNLTSISLSSPSFPITLVTAEGTSSITANYFGGSITAPNTPFTLDWNVADPGGTFSITNTNTVYTLENINNQLTTVPHSLPGVGFICSTIGAGTPYQAIMLTDLGRTGTVQCQGNVVGRINQGTTDIIETISVKPISGYQDPNTLGLFPPAKTVTLHPGVNQNVAQAVPEPLNILGTSTGLVLFGIISTALKRKKVSK